MSRVVQRREGFQSMNRSIVSMRHLRTSAAAVGVILLCWSRSVVFGQRRSAADLAASAADDHDSRLVFTTTTSINHTADEIGVNRRNSRQKLIVSTVLEEPYMILRSSGLFLAGNDRFEGYVADIFQRLATALGIDYELRLSRDGKYGDLHSDGQWNGAIGEVIKGVADVAAGALTVTSERGQYVDFTDSFLSLRSSALLRKPRSGAGGKRLSADHTPSNHHHHQLTRGDQLLTTDHSYGVVRDSVVQRLLATSTDQLHRAMWARISSFWPSAIVDSVQEGVERARRERFAFIVESPTAEYLVSRRPCDLYATEPFLDSLSYAFALRKDDYQLKADIDAQLRRMADNSELQMLYLRWWKDECVRTTHPSSSASITRRSNTTAAAAAFGLRSSSSSCHYGNGPFGCSAGVVVCCILLAKSVLRGLRLM